MLQQKRDVQSCYFAAQTMRTKIQLCFQELPVEAHTSLRDSLMNHISQINEHTNSAIVTQVYIFFFFKDVSYTCIFLYIITIKKIIIVVVSSASRPCITNVFLAKTSCGFNS